MIIALTVEINSKDKDTPIIAAPEDPNTDCAAIYPTSIWPLRFSTGATYKKIKLRAKYKSKTTRYN